MVTSIEVVERSRRADITWVEQEIAKHRRLPTNRLVLVSKSGFSENAIRAVTAEGGWVEALRPEIVMSDGKPVVTDLFINQLGLTPRSCHLRVMDPDGDTAVVDLSDNAIVEILSAQGESLGVVYQLAYEVLNMQWVGQQIVASVQAMRRPQSPNAFAAQVDIAECGYALHKESDGAKHQILTIQAAGTVSFEQVRIGLTQTKLGDRAFGSGKGTFFGRPAVWVETPAHGSTHAAARAVEGKAPDTQRLAIGIERFTELLQVREQAGSASAVDAPWELLPAALDPHFSTRQSQRNHGRIVVRLDAPLGPPHRPGD